MVNMNDVWLKQVDDTIVVQRFHDDCKQLLQGTTPTLDMVNISQKLGVKNAASPKRLCRSTSTIDLNALFDF